MKKRIPFIISVLTMFMGVAIAIMFGVNEKYFKNKIKTDLYRNKSIARILDSSERIKKINYEKSKNWRYYQRFHFHATAIGAMSLACLLLLNLISKSNLFTIVTSYMISLGGFFYPFVWLFAAMYGPEIGRSVAKEKFAVFGYMGGVFLLGLLFLMILLAMYPTIFEKKRR